MRLLVTNKMPEATTVHWHGLLLPNGMDGVAGLTQPRIEPGETYAYEFTLRQHGTQMYHPHADEMVQMALGMYGFFIIHPKDPSSPRIDNPGDWAFHCHKSHHTMNAMSHDIPNMIGVDQDKIAPQMNKLLPQFMAMGSAGMTDMSDMAMSGSKNTLPMMGGDGPFGSVGMGGMFTVVKVRENLTDYADPGWYQAPEGTRVKKISPTT